MGCPISGRLNKCHHFLVDSAPPSTSPETLDSHRSTMNVLLTPTTPLQGILSQGEKLEAAPRIPYSGKDHNDVFENAFQEYSNGSGSICQPSGWRQKTERADYKLLSQEQTPPSGTSPPSTGPQSEHTYTSPQLLGFFTSSDYYSTSYQDSNSQYACQPTAFTDAPLDAAPFGQQGYPLFHQEIENSFERRRESARRSTTDQVQYYTLCQVYSTFQCSNQRQE
jgi:hypothetical protein